MSFGLGRERRVRRRSEYLRIQSTARRLTSRHFYYLVARRPPGGPGAAGTSRLGIVVTRKIGNAVERNRVKRLCRECFRLWPGLVPAEVDLVVVARPGAPALTLDQVRAEWRSVERPLRKRCEDLAREGGGAHLSAPAPPRRESPR